MTPTDPTTARAGADGARPAPAMKSRSLNSQIRPLLLDCPSRQALFEKVLEICCEQFNATIGRVDFRIGEKPESRMTHNAILARTMADRFDAEFLAPLADEVKSAANSEPKLKRFERGEQKLSLISAPIIDIANDSVEGVVTLMLGGGTHAADVVLPRLDGIVAVVSAVLVAKNSSTQRRFREEPANNAAAAGFAASRNVAEPHQESHALANTAQFGSTKEFGYSIVNSLCGQLKAEQVFFGVEHNQRITVEAVSGIADFKASSPGIALVRQAMEECIDTADITVAQTEPPEGIDSMPLHRQWAAESHNSCVCSIPLKQRDEITGVISIRRPANLPFRQDELDKLRMMLTPYGGAIRVVEKANRSMAAQVKTAFGESARRNISKGSIGRKVTLAALGLGLLWFVFGTMTYRPLCRTRVTAAGLRHFSAPFDGKLQTVHVRPGQHVAEGDLLVEFDTVDLRLQLNGLQRQIETAQVELRRAISEDDLAVAALARSRITVLRTEAAAIQRQIKDAAIVAPMDGTVVLSDLDQRSGQVFPQGDELLQLAPEGNWLLEIEVPDDIMNYVAAEQTGTFAAASLPTEKQSFTIEHIDGAATMMQDRNVFIARAPLNSQPEWMKSGMEGTARIETVPRPVWWVVMHRAVDWARTNFWF